MLNNGFTLQDIMGRDAFKQGMTNKQMSYFLSACVTVSASRMNEQTFATSRLHADKETRKKMDAQLAKMENALVTALLKEEL